MQNRNVPAPILRYRFVRFEALTRQMLAKEVRETLPPKIRVDLFGLTLKRRKFTGAKLNACQHFVRSPPQFDGWPHKPHVTTEHPSSAVHRTRAGLKQSPGALPLSSAGLVVERAGLEHLGPATTAVAAGRSVAMYGSLRNRDPTATVRAGRMQFHLDEVGERRRGVSANSGVQSCTSR